MEYSVPVLDFIKELHLEIVYDPGNLSERSIVIPDVSRPGMMLLGFKEHFDSRRIQIIGLMEYTYLQQLDAETRMEHLERFYKECPVLVVVARNLEIFQEMKDLSAKYKVPLLHASDSTSDFMSAAISYLNVELAPRTLMHGELVEIYGEGILIYGDSGIGKSETAIELVKRGHRLVADDAVELRRISSREIVGTAPNNIRHFIELRGIGIINVRHIFGVGAVKVTEKIDMVINIEQWDNQKVYDRIGIENEKMDILGVNVESLTIPVRPGRNLAIIIEVAAMNNRQKRMGYNAAEELMNQLGMINDDSIGDIAPIS